MIWTTSARTRARLGAAAAAGVVVALTVGFGAVPASAANPTFPTWSDVLSAEKNAAAKKAEIAKITELISGLQSKSADTGKTALLAGEKYNQAEIALNEATAVASKLGKQASSAKKRAKSSSREAGQLAAQLAREGYGNISLDLLLNGRGASDLLDRLGTMSKLGETSAEIFAKATREQKTASAAGSQALIAKKAEARKAADAKAAYLDATNAADASQGQINAVSAQQKVLTAQLASLNGTTAAVEAAYLAGVAWEKKQAAQTTPPKSPPPPPSEPGAPVSSKVAAAIAFAKAQLGKPYLLGGSGPSAYDCSGLTKAAWGAAGVNIGPHGATSQYNLMKSENRLVPIGDREPGDLLFYSTGGSTSATKYHTTLYIGNGEMIEAPYPGVNVRIAAVRFGDLVPYAARPTG
jgi:cell wall-associated NlpC family hydrolase